MFWSQVKEINPGTQATDHPALCPGLVLSAVGDVSVVRIGYKQTVLNFD